MSYGYESSLTRDCRTESRLLDYLRHFMAQLDNARDPMHVCEKPVYEFYYCVRANRIVQEISTHYIRGTQPRGDPDFAGKL